jgi:DNA invertase Pin-like site-specific DNA recombinase
MLIGYARVSTHEQNLDLQLDALVKAGCSTDKTYKDKISGAKELRPELEKALDQLRTRDTLVVWRLDRLGRSLQELITSVDGIRAKGADFKSLSENIDTTTPGGKLIFHVFAALAEYERGIIRERTKAGLQAARARGRFGGRPTIQSRDPHKVALARRLYADPTMPVFEICATLHIAKSTLYRYLHDASDPARHTSGRLRLP